MLGYEQNNSLYNISAVFIKTFDRNFILLNSTSLQLYWTLCFYFTSHHLSFSREYGTIDDADIDLHINISFLDVRLPLFYYFSAPFLFLAVFM